MTSLSCEDDDYWDLHLLPGKKPHTSVLNSRRTPRQDVLSVGRTGQTQRVLGGSLGGSLGNVDLGGWGGRWKTSRKDELSLERASLSRPS